MNAVLTQTNRAGIQQGDQFFQDVRPDPTFRLGISTISAMIHPTFEVIKTTECACTDNSQDWNDETSVVIQLPFPHSPRTLQDAINSFLTSKEVKICLRCRQRQRITTTKRLRDATPVLAISVERVDHKTGKRIDLDVNITTPLIRLPVIAEELVANYELTSAIQRTTGVHFVSLLRGESGQFIRVSDNHDIEVAGVTDIRKAEIFLFKKIGIVSRV